MGHKTFEVSLTNVNLLVGNRSALRKTLKLYQTVIRRITYLLHGAESFLRS